MSKGALVAVHDNGYKLLFSHAEMVEDLLRDFIGEDWVRNLDFSSLQKVPTENVSEKALQKRESDIVWCLLWKEGQRKRWIYVYLLLEFQSTVDPLMALRVMTYIGLLYQDLVRQRLLKPGQKLPPVLPIVLYNGYALWGAPRDVTDLIQPVAGGLETYRPQLRYWLLDTNRITIPEWDTLKNLVAALFRMEQSQSPDEMGRVLTDLRTWLKPEQADLRRAFVTVLEKGILPTRMPGTEIPQIRDLEEAQLMLTERANDWTRTWKQQGFEEGKREGIREGIREGKREGIREGIEKGIEDARSSLLGELERRFGPLPEEARLRVQALPSFKDLMELSARIGAASSLADLGLTGKNG